MQLDSAESRPRVIVGVNGSASSVHALRRGAQEARSRQAVLVPVHAWLPPALIMPPLYPAIEPGTAPERAGWAILWETYDAAFSEMPWGGDVEPIVTYGHTGISLLAIANRPDDLLVLGTSPRSALKRLRHTQTVRYCVTRAECDVLIVGQGQMSARGAGAQRRI